MTETKRLLDSAREKLLDLTLRNTLLNYNIKKRGRLSIIDEMPNVLYDKLSSGSRMRFLPVPYPDIDDTTDDDEEEVDENTGLINVRTQAKRLNLNISEDAPNVVDSTEELLEKHTDNYVQTLHYADTLDKICRRIRSNANTAIQETGTNMLYLAIGFLEWKPSKDNDRIVLSPLILMPIQIERGKVDSRTGSYTYTLEYSGEDMFSNISLEYKMKEFGIALPTLEEDELPEKYFSKISELCKKYPHLLGVRRRFSVDFFHFSKLLMYQDLDPENWGEDNKILDNEVLRQIAGDDAVADTMSLAAEDASLTESLGLVMDADGSQRDAISQVLKGKNLIIEGPPGTGKSQTIANLIGAALAEGKSILFVAEKLVALEVVKKRLDNVGLGHFILELHSHKTNKLAFYTSLGDRINLETQETNTGLQEKIDEIEKIKENVNDYLKALHTDIKNISETPYNIFGNMLNLHESTFDSLPTAEAYLKLSKDEYKSISDDLSALIKLIKEDPEILHSQWKGFEITNAISIDAGSIISIFQQLKDISLSIDKYLSEEIDTLEIAFTPENISRIVDLHKSNILNNLPDTKKLHAVHSVEKSKLEDLFKRGEELLTIYDTIKDVDLDGIEDISELKDLTRNLRGFVDIGFFGKFFNSEYKKARREFLMAFTVKKKTNPETMSHEIEEVSRQIEKYQKLYEEFYLLGAKEVLGSIEYKQLDINNLSSIPKSLDIIRLVLSLKESQKWKIKAYSEGMSDELIVPLFNDNYKDYLIKIKNISIHTKALIADTEALEKELSRYGRINKEEFYNKEVITYQSIVNELENKIELSPILPMWIDVSRLLQRISAAHFMELVDYAKKNHILDDMKQLFEYGYYREWSHQVLRTNETLAKFNRHLFETYLKNFRDADKKLNGLYAKQHSLLLSKNVVPVGKGGSVREMTDMRLLRNEVNKQKAHQPIRQALKRASDAIRALKPCFMMSPLSVAQFIDPKQKPFDLVIFDEASQIFPEDALGSIARAKQVVVVGDPNQLPPSSFFSATNEQDDGEETIATSSESILDLMLRVYPNVKRLKWHYRSKHESLIAFSNHYFYDDELMIFPSPDGNEGNVGITRRFLPNAKYKNQTNPNEAIAMVEGLFQSLLKNTNESIGLVAMNKKQIELIERLIEQKTVDDGVLGSLYDNAYKAGNIFVKNLENVQGDEADVLFIGTTYGPDPDSRKVYQRFGPINGNSGWRRMNVLITRARKKIVLYTSMKSSDIAIQEGNRGRMALRNYLKYTETGVVESHSGTTTAKEPDSPFEESVIRYIQSLGYQAQPQVGVAGFFIDIGVKVENSYNFILGIECDGATYHSSRSARDRDRIRQEILESIGWNIYRIWSTDWFRHRNEEEIRLKNALEVAKSRAIMIQDEPDEEIVQEEILPVYTPVEEEPEVTEETIEIAKEDLQKELYRIRKEKVEPKFKVDSKSILSNHMIDLFCKTKPTSMEQFRISIPQYLREKIDPEQVMFMDEIFEAIENYL